MRNTNERSLSQALAIYLYWLKTGLDQDSIANHFGTITRRQVSAYCEQIRHCLTKNFVPKHLGSCHITREDFLKHNTKMANFMLDLEGSKLPLIADLLLHSKKFQFLFSTCYIQRTEEATFS